MQFCMNKLIGINYMFVNRFLTADIENGICMVTHQTYVEATNYQEMTNVNFVIALQEDDCSARSMFASNNPVLHELIEYYDIT